MTGIYLQVIAVGGTKFEVAIDECIRLAKFTKTPVILPFNGVKLYIHSNSSPEEIVKRYHEDLKFITKAKTGMVWAGA